MVLIVVIVATIFFYCSTKENSKNAANILPYHTDTEKTNSINYIWKPQVTSIEFNDSLIQIFYTTLNGQGHFIFTVTSLFLIFTVIQNVSKPFNNKISSKIFNIRGLLNDMSPKVETIFEHKIQANLINHGNCNIPKSDVHRILNKISYDLFYDLYEYKLKLNSSLIKPSFVKSKFFINIDPNYLVLKFLVYELCGSFNKLDKFRLDEHSLLIFISDKRALRNLCTYSFNKIHNINSIISDLNCLRNLHQNLMHLTLLNDAHNIINIKNDLSSTSIVKQLTNNKTKNSNGFLIQTIKLYHRNETQQSNIIVK